MAGFSPRANGGASPAPPRARRWIARTFGAGLVAASLLGVFTASAIAEPSPFYVVRPGDTLDGIAQEYGVSVDSLVATNGIANANLILVGQRLRIGAPSPSFSPLISAGIIDAPYYSQFDGSAWADSNCGPTSLSMALAGIGIKASQLDLRALSNREMRIYSADSGTTWEALAYAAHQRGARTSGLYQGRYYRRWTTGDLQSEFNQGHPVLLLVRYRALPGHAGSRYWGDHYVVALGFDANGNLVYNDPAARGDGSDLTLTPSQLANAWGRTSVGLVQTAMAVER